MSGEARGTTLEIPAEGSSRLAKAPPRAASIADATRRAVASGASPGAASATAAAAMRAATAATSTAFPPRATA